MKKTLPYGFWKSPLTPSVMSQSTRLSELQWAREGAKLVWLEGRSDQNVLVIKGPEDAPRDLTPSHNARAQVGYGGGEFTLGQNLAIFAHADGRLYSCPLGPGTPKPVTPGFGHAASPSLSADERYLVYVHSDQNVDVLALVDLENGSWPSKLSQGADFYMQPCWHPTSEWVAWIEWDHPQMPWDGSRLCLQRLDGGFPVGRKQVLHGSEEVPLFQPEFSPCGRFLSVIALGAERDQLLLWSVEEQGVTGEPEVVYEDGILAEAAWLQGLRTYVWHPSGQELFLRQSEKGFASLLKYSLSERECSLLSLPKGCHWCSQLAIDPESGRLAMLASGPKIPSALWVGDGAVWRAVRHSEAGLVPEGSLSTPVPLSWQGEDGEEVHGLFYPPTHEAFVGKGLPPAIVGVHGGPTAQRVASWSPAVAFFTSRGYGFLEVNYRGSFGFGKDYVDALKGRWGELDVQDTVSGARMLAERGLADENRLVVMGGSAGGYTVLNSLIHHPGLFKAGVCLFGVSNLFTIVSDTHKFESRYVDGLVGTLPASREKFHARSPVYHAHKIRDALAIFQGREDRVVPLSQSDSVVQSLRENKIPHHYTIFDGEGHGWRRKETIEQYYTELLSFLRQHVLFL